MRDESRFQRQHDIKVEMTFIGKGWASSARVAGAHARALLARRLLAARLKGDKRFTLQGFASNGLVVAARSPEGQKAELATLRELVLKYPVQALSIVLRVLRTRTANARHP